MRGGALERGTKRKVEGFFSEEEKNKIKILVDTRRQKSVLNSSERDRVRVRIGVTSLTFRMSTLSLSLDADPSRLTQHPR